MEFNLKKRYNIRVMGQDFLILSDKGDNHVESVVQFVNEKARELGSTSKDVTTLGISILVALNMADELLQARDEMEHMRSQFKNKTEKLISFIEKRKNDVGYTLRCS